MLLGLNQFSAHGLLRFKILEIKKLCSILQVIAVNGKFPGPTINVTTNYHLVVNVKNKLDEGLLLHW